MNDFTTYQPGDYVRVTWLSAGTIPATRKTRLARIEKVETMIQLEGFQGGWIKPDDGYEIRRAE